MNRDSFTRRTWLATLAALGTLAGCGFELRQSAHLPFQRIHLGFDAKSALGQELRRALLSAPGVQVVDARAVDSAQVLLDALSESREKVVVGLNGAGQVLEFQLRQRLRYTLRTANGLELQGPTELEVHRDLSFNESNVLAKEAEEALLYRDMQADLVQQLMRRLAAVRWP